MKFKIIQVNCQGSILLAINGVHNLVPHEPESQYKLSKTVPHISFTEQLRLPPNKDMVVADFLKKVQTIEQ